MLNTDSGADAFLSDLIGALRGIIPNENEALVGGFMTIIGTMCCYLFGCWDRLIEALLVAIALDYISGVFAAYLDPRKKLDSKKGFKGILKKIMILLLVAVAHFIDYAIGQDFIRNMVILFFLGNEGLSVIENAANAGLPIPEKLRDTLEQLMDEEEHNKVTKE